MLTTWYPAWKKQGGKVPDGEILDGELAVVNQVEQEGLRQNQLVAPELARLQRSLSAASHTNVLAWQKFEGLCDEFHAELPAPDSPSDTPEPASTASSERGRRKKQADDSAGRVALGRFDPHRAMVSIWFLAIVEIGFLVVETFFWYSLFTETVDRRAGWGDPTRISALLLALFIPAVGLAVVRLLSKLAHRWVMDYPGCTRRRTVGAVVAIIAFVAVMVGVFWLVEFRFDEGAMVGSAPIPPFPMALTFTIALVADAGLRIYLTSEVRHQQKVVLRRFWAAAQKASDANQAHCDAWAALQYAVQHSRTQIGRLGAVGRELITESSVEAGEPHLTRPIMQVPPTVQIPQSAQVSKDRLAFVLPGTQPLVPVHDKYRPSSQPMLDLAIDALRQFPPRNQEGVTRDIGSVRSQLFGSSKSTTHEAVNVPRNGIRESNNSGPLRTAGIGGVTIPLIGRDGPSSPTVPSPASADLNGHGDAPQENRRDSTNPGGGG